VFHFTLILFPFLDFVHSLFLLSFFRYFFFLCIVLSHFIFRIYLLVSFYYYHFFQSFFPLYAFVVYFSFSLSVIFLSLSVFLHSPSCNFLHFFFLHTFNISSRFLFRLLFHLYLLHFFPSLYLPLFLFYLLFLFPLSFFLYYNDFSSTCNARRMQTKTDKCLLCSTQSKDPVLAPLQETVTSHTPIVCVYAYMYIQCILGGTVQQGKL
jgi:hypothetical protein